MSGTVFIEEDGGWVPLAYVPDDGISLTCERNELDAPHCCMPSGELSFSCEFDALSDAFEAMGSAADDARKSIVRFAALHVPDDHILERVYRMREMRAVFMRKRKIGGTRNHSRRKLGMRKTVALLFDGIIRRSGDAFEIEAGTARLGGRIG